MIASALILLMASLSAGPARAADAPSPPAYDATAAPLDALSRDLLSTGGYELRADGKVWDDVSEAPVSRDAMPDLLTRLAGARRLKALIQLDQIFNRYDSERNLSDDDRQAVRALVRDAWPVFGFSTRRDYRVYFAPQELEILDKIPPYAAPGLGDMIDPPVSITAGAPPDASTGPLVSITAAAPPAASSAAPVALTAAPPTLSSAAAAGLAAVGAASASSGAAAGSAALAPLTARPALARPTAITSAPSAPARAAAAAHVVFLPFTTPSGSTSTAVSPRPVIAGAGQLKAWTPPSVSTATRAAVAASSAAAVAVSSAVAAAPPAAGAPPPPPPPKPAAVSAADYDKFVADGPYARESKDLLALIAKRAPDFCLPLLRRTVVGALPQIVFDGRLSGAALRAGPAPVSADAGAPPTIALSPGPVFVERRRGLFSPREALLLPEAPQAWVDLGVPAPALDALKTSPPAVAARNGAWGATREYADGSRRGTYSPQEQAGELLEQLLLLGLRREGFATSEYAARRWARVAKLMFWTSLKNDFGDAFLDPDRRGELDDWLDHPDELDDTLAASWASARDPVLDPRRGPPADERAFNEKARLTCVRSNLRDLLAASARRRARRVGLLEELLDAGLVSTSAAKASAQIAADTERTTRRILVSHPPACPAEDPAHAEGLRRSALLLAEAARAEGALRERRAEAGDHATR